MYPSFFNGEHQILLRCKVQKRFEQQQLEVLRLEQAHLFFSPSLDGGGDCIFWRIVQAKCDAGASSNRFISILDPLEYPQMALDTFRRCIPKGWWVESLPRCSLRRGPTTVRGRRRAAKDAAGDGLADLAAMGHLLVARMTLVPSTKL